MCKFVNRKTEAVLKIVLYRRRGIMLYFIQKSKLPLKKLYTFVSYFLKRVDLNRQAKKKGRPQKYEDALIITL
jgi:hypothetical protein